MGLDWMGCGAADIRMVGDEPLGAIRVWLWDGMRLWFGHEPIRPLEVGPCVVVVMVVVVCGSKSGSDWSKVWLLQSTMLYHCGEHTQTQAGSNIN